MSSNTTERATEISSALSFLAGGVTGILSRLLTYPLDTIKTRLQTDQRGSRKKIVALFGRLACKGEIASLYSGFGAVLVFAIPGNACYFGGFELGKKLAPDIYPLPDLSAGITAQLLANVLYTPMDVIKERRQTGVLKKNPLFDIQLRNHFINAKNVLDLFRGYWMSNSLWMPWSAIFALSYNYLKDKTKQKESYTTSWTTCISAFMAASLATTVTHPIDVIKTQLQVFSSQNTNVFALSLVKKMLKEEGIKGFYRGYIATIISKPLSVAFSWFMFELVKNKIQKTIDLNKKN